MCGTSSGSGPDSGSRSRSKKTKLYQDQKSETLEVPELKILINRVQDRDRKVWSRTSLVEDETLIESDG